MVLKGLSLATLFVLVVAFQNCGEFASDPQAHKKIYSSQCMANIRAKAQIDIPLDVCNDISNYLCERRIFRPGIGYSRAQESACFTTASGTEACVQVDTYRYDTESARKGNSDPSAFKSAGEYNREEIQCTNQQAKFQDLNLIQTEGESIESALLTAMRFCRERSGK